MAQVVLTDFRSDAGSSRATATLTPAGDLLIEGQDVGDVPEDCLGLGYREYEWTVTIGAQELSALLKALGGTDLLASLQEQFGERTATLLPFLREHGIRFEFWSRRGD